MVDPGERAQLANGLLARGLVIPLQAHQLIYIDGKLLVNGLMGVTKGKKLPLDSAERPGEEILKLIMNLTATNSVQTIIQGDVKKLPYIGQWRCLLLEDGQVLLWSADDLKGAFYIFRLPECWAPYFAFDIVFDGKEIGQYWLGGSPCRWVGCLPWV